VKKISLCVALFFLIGLFFFSCMSGSGEPPDEDTCPDCYLGDDDGGSGADDDDSADDDDVDDDDATDDDDDPADDDDDDTTPPIDCTAVIDEIYTECGQKLFDGIGKPVLESDATDYCAQGGEFWLCADQCRIDNDEDCEAFAACINDECNGHFHAD